MLQIKIQEKSYSNKPILQDIQLSISQPGLYGIVGANGAGKTTFFKCLSSLESFEGEILYQGIPEEVICQESLQAIYGVQSKVAWTSDQQAMIQYL